ncbi:MAG TPA: peptidoglycan DD-metalloendopeptidase family protein, partial [Burkholderiales bacterium]
LRLRAPENIVQVQPASGAGAIEARPLGSDAPAAAPLPTPAPSPAPAARAPGQAPLVTGPKAQKLPWSDENVALLARADAAAAQSQAPALASAPGTSRPDLAKPAPIPAPAPAPQASQGPDDGADRVDWVWPATGKVVAGFSDASNKGVDIAGRVGDPVFASAGGRVVYSGQGLRGYGKLIIIKHNNTYLSAYAHNSNLLVKEGQNVVRGQKIAEIGSTDASQAKLHFEIRRLGKPIDPAKLLPERP